MTVDCGAAAYDACMLLAMQDTPVDMMNYYSGDNSFFVATGITDGELLGGVRYRAGSTQ